MNWVSIFWDLSFLKKENKNFTSFFSLFLGLAFFGGSKFKDFLGGLFFFLSWFWDLSFFFIPLSGVAAYFGFLFGIVLFCCLYQVPRLTVTVQEREKETNSDMCRVPVFVCSGCGEWVRHRFCAPRYCSLKSCTKSSETGRGIKDQPCQPGCSPLRCGTLVTTLLKCYDCANFVHTETEDACLAAEEEAKGAAEAVDEPPPPPLLRRPARIRGN